MSKIVYMGNMAGLTDVEGMKGKSVGGDMNSPYDYVVICTCGQHVGPLGRFVPNAQGMRTPLCACNRVIIIDDSGQIRGEKMLTSDDIAKLAQAQGGMQ